MTEPVLLEIDWPLPPGVRAACTTRQGGVSLPPWDSMNLGTHVGDAPDAVATNRGRLKSLLRLPAEPCWLNQVHGTDVADLDAWTPGGTPTTADAAISLTTGNPCVIMVADCLPVLFASGHAEVELIAELRARNPTARTDGILKPFGLELLRERVEALLAR